MLDTHFDLLDTDIPSKHFVCLQDVFKTCFQDVLEDEKLLPRRRVEDVFQTCLEDHQMFAGIRINFIFINCTRAGEAPPTVSYQACTQDPNLVVKTLDEYISRTG